MDSLKLNDRVEVCLYGEAGLQDVWVRARVIAVTEQYDVRVIRVRFDRPTRNGVTERDYYIGPRRAAALRPLGLLDSLAEAADGK